MKKQSILPLLSAAVLAGGLLAPSVSMAGTFNNAGPCRHWDKIIFELKNVQIVRAIQDGTGGQTEGLTLPKNQPLDILERQNPNDNLRNVFTDATDVVLQRFNVPVTTANRNAIRIIDVDYAIECPEDSSFSSFD